MAALLSTSATAGDRDFEAALRKAADDNPSLHADEARQDAAQARLRGTIDAFLPTVAVVHERILNSHVSYNPDIAVPTTGVDTTTRREPDLLGIQVSLPLFDGFQRYNDYQAARRHVEAGRHLGVDARQQVLLDTVVAYLSVLRDRAIVDHRRRQVDALAAIVERTARRFSTQDVTRSDTALAQARKEGARIALRQAEAALQRSTIEFTRLTGAPPGRLAAPPSPDPMLPRTVDDLRSALLTANPKLAAARLETVAAQHTANSAFAALSPKVNLEFTHGTQSNLSSSLHTVTDTTIKIVAKIPLYTPGAFPKIEEAKASSRQKMYDSIDAERRAVSEAESLFAERAALRAELSLAKRRIAAISEAVRAQKVEQGAGYRTITEELDAEAELAEAEISRQTLIFETNRIGYTIAAALARIGEQGSIGPVAARP